MRLNIALLLGLACSLGLTACNGDMSGKAGGNSLEATALQQGEHSILYGTKDDTKAHDAVVSLFC